MYFENLKLGISNHCANENYDGYLSTRKIYEIFGIPSMTFLTNFFSDFEFVPQWNTRNGARTVYVKQLSQKRALRMANKSKLVYSSEFEVLFDQILNKNGGFVFLSDLNRQFIKYFDASMDPQIVIHKLLAKHSNIHYLPWNYSFSEKGSKFADQQSMKWCDQIVFDVNNPNIDSIVQIPILVKLFRHDFNHCKRLLSHHSHSTTTTTSSSPLRPFRVYSHSTNYRDHLVQRDAFATHLKHHGKLKYAVSPSDWGRFLEEVERDGVSYFALNHDAILDALRSTFMGETAPKSNVVPTGMRSMSPHQESKVNPIGNPIGNPLASLTAPSTSSSSDSVMPIKEMTAPSRTSIDSTEGLYQRLDDMVSSFETKLDKVLRDLQQRQLPPLCNVGTKQMDEMIDGNAHLQLTGNCMKSPEEAAASESVSSFLNSQKSTTTKQSLSVFGEETLKAMLLDCCKSGYSKPAINIASYMAQQNMLCDTEHYIGLMRLQYDSLSTEIWKEMVQRHFLTEDAFVITVQTFQALRVGLSDQWFKALLLNNVQKLTIYHEMSTVERQQNEEIMSILLKYVQEYSQEDLADWFSRYVQLDTRPLNTRFWKKAALMLAVVFSKNASSVHYTPKSYNEALQRCLEPWCHDIDIGTKSMAQSVGSYGRKTRGKSSPSFLSDDDEMEFVAQQLEQLIMRVSNSAELMDSQSLHKLLKLYSTTISNSCTPAASHIVRDRLQYICLSVLQRQKGPISREIMSLLEASRVNTEYIEQKLSKSKRQQFASSANSLQQQPQPQQQEQGEEEEEPLQLHDKMLADGGMKKELLASFANTGDVEALLLSMESVDKLLSSSKREDIQIGGGHTLRRKEVLHQHHMFLREAINKFLNRCTDINLSFVMMDKLLRSRAGQRVVTFGYFQRMIDIGIRAPTATSHWFQIKNLLQLLLALPYRTILQIDIFDKLINYCLVHQDIVGLTDALQMLFDWTDDEHRGTALTTKLSADLMERIMEFIATKSGDAALHLFQRLSPLAAQPTLRCLYWVLAASADRGDVVGTDTVRDLMVTNGILQEEWDVEVYNAIIRCNSFSGALKMEESLHLLDDLVANGLTPNIETFNGLLSHHRGSGVGDKQNDNEGDGSMRIDVDFMLNLMEQMEVYHVKASHDTFGIILEFCAQHKEREIALKLWATIHELPDEEREAVIANASVWLHYVQCFGDYRETATQIKGILQKYGGISRQLLTNEMFEYLCRITFGGGADDREQAVEEVVFSNTVIRMRNIENVIECIVDRYEDTVRDCTDRDSVVALDMNGFCRVFEGMYLMEKSAIHSLNIETGIYNLRQIESVFWRLMDKMKDLNIFFPDPDLLRPYLFLKDLEMECYSKSQSADVAVKYENIVDGVFRFIEYGVFVSPELIEDLCGSIGIEQERTRCILNSFRERRHQQKQVRIQQPLPRLSC